MSHQYRAEYSEEFCLEVVRKSDKKLSTLVAIAHQLGVSLQQIQIWRNQLKC
jgi:transposase-like protein